MSATLHYRRPPLWYRLRETLDAVDLTPKLRKAAAFGALVALGALWGVLVALAGEMAALLCVSAIACVFCMRDFRVGAVLLLLIMPISEASLFPRAMFGITGLNPLNVLIATTLVSLFMRTVGDGTWKRFVPGPVFLLYLVPLAAGVLIGATQVHRIPAYFRDIELVFYSNAVGYVRDELLKPLLMVIYALLVAAAVERSERPERLLRPILFSILVMALLAITYVAFSGASLSELSGVYARHFLSAIGMHANDLGRLYATAYALLLFLWDRSENGSARFGLLLLMGLVTLALMLTFSRGAFTGFIIVNLLFLWSRRHRIGLLLLALAAAPVALYLMPGAFIDRITLGFSGGGGADVITAGRVGEIWMPLMPEVMANPLLGHGVSSILWSRAMLDGRILQVGHPHNAYLEALMDHGLIGFALLLLFWIYVWRRFRELKGDPRLSAPMQGFFEGASVGLVAFLVAGMAGSSLRPVPEQAFLWLAIGMMFGMRRRLAAQAA